MPARINATTSSTLLPPQRPSTSTAGDFSPPVLAACPAARCVDEDCPQPGRPRSGCVTRPFAPRVSHGAFKSTGTASHKTAASKRRRQTAHILYASGTPMEEAVAQIGSEYRASIERWYTEAEQIAHPAP